MLSAHQEHARLLDHFANVLRRLETRTPSGLTASQHRTRRGLIDELRRYRERGRFPRNRLFRRFNPTFIDLDGTRCAVAHLLDRSDQRGLALDVAQAHNYARVPALLALEELRSWADRSGLSAQEAALIQPGYCRTAWACVCSGEDDELFGPFVGVAEATIVSSSEVVIDAIHGVAGGAVVGDTFAFEASAVLPMSEVGQRVVGPLVDSVVVGHLAVGPDGLLVLPEFCQMITEPAQIATPAALEIAAYVDAMLAPDCVAALQEHDFRWGLEKCDGGAIISVEPEGCSFAGASSGSSWLLALSVLATSLVTRRLRAQ